LPPTRLNPSGSGLREVRIGGGGKLVEELKFGGFGPGLTFRF